MGNFTDKHSMSIWSCDRHLAHGRHSEDFCMELPAPSLLSIHQLGKWFSLTSATKFPMNASISTTVHCRPSNIDTHCNKSVPQSLGIVGEVLQQRRTYFGLEGKSAIAQCT